MIAEIITIGDEILIGQVVDTNSAWIAEQLNLIGINVFQITSISDNKDHIYAALNAAIKRSKIVLITGGLGPTNDDITKQTLCDYFGTELVFNEQVYANIVNLLLDRGFSMNELNRKQAEVPENCVVLENKIGTAPGMWFKKNSTIFISMPGVPFEMKEMMKTSVLPYLKEHFNAGVICHKTVLTQGIAESALAEKIADWEAALPDEVHLAYLPSPGIVRLRLTGNGTCEKQLKDEMEKNIQTLNEIIPDHIFGYNDDVLEGVVGNLLAKNKSTLSIAESCTGGNIAHMITSVAGSSAYFKGSMVAYSNELKIKELSIDSQIIQQFGAVSKEVVELMAKNICSKFATDYSIATSGIAGPDGGLLEKPVGTVWIAVANNNIVISQKFNFGEHRQRTIQKASLAALNMLRKLLLNL